MNSWQSLEMPSTFPCSFPLLPLFVPWHRLVHALMVAQKHGTPFLRTAVPLTLWALAFLYLAVDRKLYGKAGVSFALLFYFSFLSFIYFTFPYLPLLYPSFFPTPSLPAFHSLSFPCGLIM